MPDSVVITPPHPAYPALKESFRDLKHWIRDHADTPRHYDQWIYEPDARFRLLYRSEDTGYIEVVAIRTPTTEGVLWVQYSTERSEEQIRLSEITVDDWMEWWDTEGQSILRDVETFMAEHLPPVEDETISVTIPAQVAIRLHREARRQGLTIEQFLLRVASNRVLPR